MHQQTMVQSTVAPGCALLATWRKEKNLTQAELGIMLHVTATSVCDWERGKKLPKIQHAIAIAELTSIPVSAWLPVGVAA